MSAQHWTQAVRQFVLTTLDYLRRQQQLHERYLLAWPPEPIPLHWVRRGEDWVLHGDVLSEPGANDGTAC